MRKNIYIDEEHFKILNEIKATMPNESDSAIYLLALKSLNKGVDTHTHKTPFLPVTNNEDRTITYD